MAALAALPRAGEAQTPGICSDTPPSGYSVYCGWNNIDIVIDLRNQSVETTGFNETAVQAFKTGAGKISIGLTGTTVETTGARSEGVWGYLGNAASTEPIAIDITGGSITTAGSRAYGILGQHAGAGEVDIDFAGGSISTAGSRAVGIFAYQSGTGNLDVDMTSGTIVATGDDARGILAFIPAAANKAGVAVDVTGGTVAAEGRSGYGAYGVHSGLGSVSMTTGAEAKSESPFAIGLVGRLTSSANAEGRIVIAHGGAVEARIAGVLAWASGSSGHTAGAGIQTLADDARTAPMIAVSSSGTIAAGASVTDAFVRRRIAGADETLSTGEKAVFDAILAEDSDALDTALAALPAGGYDAAWKAEARSLLARLAPAPTAAGAANLAAEEILGLSHAGIRASALHRTSIAAFVRQGDRDPAILATDAADRTPQQLATLAEQEKLSAAERTVLQAVLTGRGLETALAALPAAYTNSWKDGVRQRAASYNVGDIHVEVTGGSIASGGDGVQAFYAVPHDLNGAIAVTVAAGARVTGGANGIYVRGAGVGEDFRTQSVTVNGAVTGGTGAGVYMAGGGRLTIGASGEVRAASGVGVLADGAGAANVTVEGRVAGDIRAGGSGALTANIRAGGVVTGTIRNPRNLRVAGSVGRILYDNGGTATIAAGGAVTGVEIDGTRETIRAVAGDLSVTAAGRIEGDLRPADGGALTANIRAGGAVTGTIRNPASPMTVHGSVGRILYDNGGTVTIAAGGAVTGVEIDGTRETIRAVAGDLSVTAAGRIEGDLGSSGDGALTANIRAGGVVTGTIRNPKTLTVAGRVARVLYDNGGTLTVAAGGSVTGVEGQDGAREAIRSDAGNLDVTVAANGAVAGDIAERGAGDLDAAVSGAVTGDIRGAGAGVHKVAVQSAGVVTGTVRLPANAETTIAGKVGRVHYDNGGAVTVNASGAITGLEIEGTREAIRSAAGDLAVTVHGTVTGNIEALGDGGLTVKVSEAGTINGEIFGRGGGTHTIEIAEKARVLGTVHNPKSGTTVRGAAGRVLFDNGGVLTVAATGRISGVDGEAIRADAGGLSVTVASGGAVTGRIEGRGAGAMTVNVSGAVTGAIHGKGPGKHEVTIASGGMVTGDIVDMDAGDLVASVAGRLEGSIEEHGAGDLTAAVTGAVTGNIRGMGAGSHTVAVMERGSVAGTVHLPSGATTVAGRVGRILYDNGGSVTVAATGGIAGVETPDGDREAIRSAAGDLSVAVAGRVAGGIRAPGGKLTLESAAGGVVTGTVRNPGSPMTVRGSIGRILYDNGGSIAVAGGGAITGIENEGTIEAIRSAAGDLTVDVAAMAAVTGDIRGEGEGNLDVEVSGAVKGGIFGLGGGEHDVDIKPGGAVEGLIHLAASAVTVDGSARSVRFDRGGTVAVGAEGRISGLGGRAVHSASGDLTVMIDGNVMGSIEGLGAGALTVTVANALTGDVIGGGGGMHRLTVRPGAVFKGNAGGIEAIRIAGRAEGTLDIPPGGEVTIPAGGALVGAEDAQGRRAAIIAETGALSLTVEGNVEGAVNAADAGAASTVTVGAGGAIEGKVTLAGAGSAAGIDGSVQSMEMPGGGTVTVGENGRIEEPVAGPVAVTVQAAADESSEAAARRIGGGRVDSEATVTLAREGRTGARLAITADGRIRIGPAPRHRVYEALPSVLLALNTLPDFGGALASAGARGEAAAARYELAANADMAVARTADARRGAWARFHAGGGDRRPASAAADSAHDVRRYAFEAGLEGAVGGNALVSVSVHRVRGEADVEGTEDEGKSGAVEASGTGARLSGAWFPAEDYYMGGQAAATLYEADLNSADPNAGRGVLKRGVSGRGYMLAVEAGRRFDLGRMTGAPGMAGMAVTPRARMSWSRIDMSPFTDSTGERVSLEGRSVKARAGVRVETAAPVGSVFATVDVERELSGSMRATAADTVLKAEAEPTWLRLGLGGAHEWAGGRFVLRAAANYAAARNDNRDFAGSASLTVRF